MDKINIQNNNANYYSELIDNNEIVINGFKIIPGNKYRYAESGVEVSLIIYGIKNSECISITKQGVVHFHNSENWIYKLIKKTAYDDIQPGTPVVLKSNNDNDHNSIGVFVGINDEGKPLIKFVTNEKPIPWDNCRIATKKDLGI